MHETSLPGKVGNGALIMAMAMSRRHAAARTKHWPWPRMTGDCDHLRPGDDVHDAQGVRDERSDMTAHRRNLHPGRSRQSRAEAPNHPPPHNVRENPSCAGGSSGTIRTSSKSWAWAITKAQAGAAFTTTPASASQPTASWSPCGRRFRPQEHLQAKAAKHLAFPRVTDPAAPPIRLKRHVPTSIPTIRRRLTTALVSRLQRCPCCARASDTPPQLEVYDAVRLLRCPLSLVCADQIR
jgi:hypothetical protein